MGATPRLGLPTLSVGQSQKEIFHNEALQNIDTLLCAAIEEGPRSDPPSAPSIGTCYIVGPAATGDWAGREQYIATFSSGGWRLIPPVEGTSAFVKSQSTYAQFRSGAWEFGILRGERLLVGGMQVVGNRVGSIPTPTGGTTMDLEARASITLILDAMRNHGLIES